MRLLYAFIPTESAQASSVLVFLDTLINAFSYCWKQNGNWYLINYNRYKYLNHSLFDKKPIILGVTVTTIQMPLGLLEMSQLSYSCVHFVLNKNLITPPCYSFDNNDQDLLEGPNHSFNSLECCQRN